MSRCISEPVSYLLLERYVLRELPHEEHTRVAEHLAECVVCRDCCERIQADSHVMDVETLMAAVRAAPQPKPAGRRRLWGAGAVVASLACLLLFLRTQPDIGVTRGVDPGAGIPTTRQTKGDGLALELVRADAAGRLLEPTKFAAGDRFKLLLSCPQGHEGTVRVLAFQGGEVFEPVTAQALDSCGNRRALTGAWQLDGDDPVDVCVVLTHAADDLTHVRAPDALRPPHVCARVNPAP
jgi:hypothetical protein